MVVRNVMSKFDKNSGDSTFNGQYDYSKCTEAKKFRSVTGWRCIRKFLRKLKLTIMILLIGVDHNLKILKDEYSRCVKAAHRAPPPAGRATLKSGIKFGKD
ncbi:hypothetical protein Fot_32253 [Forsythia ovata]|uniref:Uncharacterized protein n=1 Tax=Forsythia ovata TaxID=205694 RepID=A0ABD1T7A4_9LAMI